MYSALTSSPDAAPSYDDMSDSEFDAFLKETGPELRAADRDLREIQALDQRGVAGAGKLLGQALSVSTLTPLNIHRVIRT